MANYDDLLNGNQQTPPQGFDKEAWAAGKKQEREGLYTLADQTALRAVASPEAFKQYLDMQARFDRYSATNALLVMAQRPDAKQLGDLDYWKSQRVFIKRDELPNAVIILAPGSEYTRNDGSIGTNMTTKRVYDISQAERVRVQPVRTYDEGKLIRALVKAAPAQMEGVDALGGRDAVYDPAQNKIFVQCGMSALEIMQAVARESCVAQLGENAGFEARVGTQLICAKFGIDSGMAFSDVRESFDGLEAKEVREVLSNARNAAAEITGRMTKELEPKPKQQGAR
ncbi:MAG: hypothetical protein FWE40_01045 [Oscillospiraceae bacterium]|nr:hypothetical protein [Oscillospiraceae bacterium]